MQKDTYRHKGLRKKLITELQNKGISDNRILDAIMNIPRHYFMDDAFADWAYKDVPFKIEADQTISQPFTVAYMTQLLELEPKQKVLEVGTGSGYQAAVLSYLGAKVYSIERQPLLHKQTSAFLRSIGYEGIRLLYGDGYMGYKRFAPYDRIIVTAGATQVPKPLLSQLSIGGILVIPVNLTDGGQEMVKIKRMDESQFSRSTHGVFKFVPMLPGVNE